MEEFNNQSAVRLSLSQLGVPPQSHADDEPRSVKHIFILKQLKTQVQCYNTHTPTQCPLRSRETARPSSRASEDIVESGGRSSACGVEQVGHQVVRPRTENGTRARQAVYSRRQWITEQRSPQYRGVRVEHRGEDGGAHFPTSKENEMQENIEQILIKSQRHFFRDPRSHIYLLCTALITDIHTDTVTVATAQ